MSSRCGIEQTSIPSTFIDGCGRQVKNSWTGNANKVAVTELCVVTPGRFELPTCGLGNRCSIHLSYGATSGWERARRRPSGPRSAVPELLPGQCLERSKRERINPLSTGYYMPTGHGQVSIAEFMAHWLPLRSTCTPIAVPRKHDEKWLCPQEKAALHNVGDFT